MTARYRFSLDTNILVYAVDLDAGIRHKISKSIIDRAVLCDCVLPVQVLAEFFHATTRKQILPVDHAKDFVEKCIDLFTLTEANSEGLIDAMRFVEAHGISFWDAMLWVTAQRSGCTVILSEDMQDGRWLGSTEIINPFEQKNEAKIDRLLQPE